MRIIECCDWCKKRDLKSQRINMWVIQVAYVMGYRKHDTCCRMVSCLSVGISWSNVWPFNTCETCFGNMVTLPYMNFCNSGIMWSLYSLFSVRILFAHVLLEHVGTYTWKHDKLGGSGIVINDTVYIIVDCWSSKRFLRLKWDYMKQQQMQL